MVFSKILQHFFLDVFVGSSIKIALVSGAELMQLVYVFFFFCIIAPPVTGTAMWWSPDQTVEIAGFIGFFVPYAYYYCS